MPIGPDEIIRRSNARRAALEGLSDEEAMLTYAEPLIKLILAQQGGDAVTVRELLRTTYREMQQSTDAADITDEDAAAQTSPPDAT